MFLVTGADGFIGSHVVDHLVRDGHAVRALVLYNAFDSWGWLEDLEPEVRAAVDVRSGDVRDQDSLRPAIQGCTHVAHLAALIGIPYSYTAPGSYLDTNVRGTLNVTQLVHQLGLERMVHISTSEVYGSARSVPMCEEHPLRAQSPYAASKIAADQIALSYHRSFGTPICVVRPFNAYGPRQSTRAVIPSVIVQIASGRRHLELGSLFPTRDFSYVEDTARGVVAALTSEQGVGEVIHLGSGFEISIGDLVGLIAEVMDVEVRVETSSERVRPGKSEVERLWCNASKALELFGWKPQYGGLEGLRRGLEHTSRWFSKPRNLARYKDAAYTV